MLDKINKDLKAAMLGRDQVVVGTLKMLKSAIQNEGIAKRSELSDDDIVRVLIKQAKQRQEAAELYASAGDTTRAEAEQAELKIIEKYLPEPLSDEEISKLVDDAIADLTKDGEAPHKGAVIQAVIVKAGGRANGKEVAQLVNKRMS